jgi:hypothetical protein
VRLGGAWFGLAVLMVTLGIGSPRASCGRDACPGAFACGCRVGDAPAAETSECALEGRERRGFCFPRASRSCRLASARYLSRSFLDRLIADLISFSLRRLTLDEELAAKSENSDLLQSCWAVLVEMAILLSKMLCLNSMRTANSIQNPCCANLSGVPSTEEVFGTMQHESASEFDVAGTVPLFRRKTGLSP